jgi:hypothetical protein
MNNSTDIDSELSPRLEYFAERLNLVFSFFFFTLEFSDDEDLAQEATNHRAWALKTIANACLHTSLIALRDIDEFLRPRTSQSKPDDVKASFCA